MVVVLLFCSPSLAQELTKNEPQVGASHGERLLSIAQQLLGVRFDLGGRLRGREGIDCQGVIFYAAERLGPCDWRSWSVLPTQTLAHRELGAPVTEKAMVKENLVLSELQPGDVLFFLSPASNPKEEALTLVDTARGLVPMWTWHMGLYAGQGRVLHADPFTHGEVAVEDLGALMTTGGFDALLATRPTPQDRPPRCRRGHKMPTVNLSAP